MMVVVGFGRKEDLRIGEQNTLVERSVERKSIKSRRVKESGSDKVFEFVE